MDNLPASTKAEQIRTARELCKKCGCVCCRRAEDRSWIGDTACHYALKLRRLTR